MRLSFVAAMNRSIASTEVYSLPPIMTDSRMGLVRSGTVHFQTDPIGMGLPSGLRGKWRVAVRIVIFSSEANGSSIVNIP